MIDPSVDVVQSKALITDGISHELARQYAVVSTLVATV